MRLPVEYAPLAYGIIQAAITTGVATVIATWQTLGWQGFPMAWLGAWSVAWLTMLPVVAGISPLIQRAVKRMTET